MRRGLAAIVCSLALGLCAAPGCLERELVIRPDPQDSVVFVDGRPVERGDDGLPTLRFEYYGTRSVVVRKDGKEGYEAKQVFVTLDPPWYQWFPLDFFCDVLWPFTIQDRREVSVKLEPRTDLQEDDAAKQVLRRARDFAIEENRRP